MFDEKICLPIKLNQGRTHTTAGLQTSLPSLRLSPFSLRRRRSRRDARAVSQRFIRRSTPGSKLWFNICVQHFFFLRSVMKPPLKRDRVGRPLGRGFPCQVDFSETRKSVCTDGERIRRKNEFFETQGETVSRLHSI